MQTTSCSPRVVAAGAAYEVVPSAAVDVTSSKPLALAAAQKARPSTVPDKTAASASARVVPDLQAEDGA